MNALKPRAESIQAKLEAFDSRLTIIEQRLNLLDTRLAVVVKFLECGVNQNDNLIEIMTRLMDFLGIKGTKKK